MTTADRKRLAALEAEVVQLRAEVARLKAEPREWHWHSHPPLFVSVPPYPSSAGRPPTYTLRMEGTIPEPPVPPVWARGTTSNVS